MASTNKDDSIKVSQIDQGRNQVNATGSMRFEVFILNANLIVSESSFTFFLEDVVWKRARARTGEFILLFLVAVFITARTG